VYEEELGLRDGFRWSPDGRRIAYWQLDASGVRDFLLINNTDSLYSFTIPVQYPKTGTTNSAARVGVVSASGGNTTWLQVPGDPRNHYIARMDWAAGSDEVILQQLNRLQNTNNVMLGEATTGRVRSVLVERDSAWTDVVNDLRWLDGGKSFTWISERDGWRHLYVVSRDGRKTRLVTKEPYDLHNPSSAFGEPLVSGVDSTKGLIYYTASPENGTQLYLYRSRLDGKGKAERVTPRNQPGYHLYRISQDGRWALHTYSSFGTPPIVEVVSLPEHRVVRTLVKNERLRSMVSRLRRGPAGFVKVAAGSGLQLDGWVMKPADFDSTRRYPVFFHVYGEPASQTALDIWGAGNYLWHLMLTQIVPGTPDIQCRLSLAPDADTAGLRRGLARQPRYAGASWTRVSEGRVPKSRYHHLGRSGSGAPYHAELALGGLDTNRCLGLERRRVHHTESDVPPCGAVSHRHGRGSNGRYPAV
jgi:dipeptidyl-peptidase-4